MSADALASALARSLEKRKQLLKLMTMNHFDMEENSRMERLVEFKTVYGESIRAMDRVLEKHQPVMGEEDRQAFLYMFFPFIYGIYPYAEVSDKQREAMEKAGTDFQYHSIYEIAYPFIRKLLEAYV